MASRRGVKPQPKADTSKQFSVFNKVVAAFAVFTVLLVTSADPYSQEQLGASNNTETVADLVDQQDVAVVDVRDSDNAASLLADARISDEDSATLSAPIVMPDAAGPPIPDGTPLPSEIEAGRAAPLPNEMSNPDRRESVLVVGAGSPDIALHTEATALYDNAYPTATTSPSLAAPSTPPIVWPASMPPPPLGTSAAAPAPTPLPVATPQTSAIASAFTPVPLIQQGTPTPPIPQVAAANFGSLSVNYPFTPTYRVYLPLVTVNGAGSALSAFTPTPTPTPTFTPTPTPTPIRPLPYTAEDVVRVLEAQPTRTVDRQSKIGIGVYADGGGYVLNETLRLRPGLVVLMDPKPEFAREIRRQLPKAFILGRRYAASQPLDNPEARGTAFADYVAELAVPLRGVVDGWMSYNEPVGRGDVAGFKAYNTFQVAFAKQLQGTYGIGAMAGNDPPGAVDIMEYPNYFGEAIRISKYLGLHAYGSPNSLSLREPDASWYTLRYRRIHQALQDAGIKSGPIVLTEVGLAKGWRESGVNEESVTADAIWLSDEVAKDDYLLGFAMFGIFPNQGWQPFNLSSTSILSRLSRYDPANPIQITPTPLIPRK